MKIFFILLFILVMGCDMSASKNSQEKEFAHANGLHLKFAGSFESIQQTDQGYIIHISPEDSRQADQIVVQYQDEKPDDLKMVKVVQGQQIFYREEIGEEGSGGWEMTLELWKKADQGRGVYVEHYRQSEGRPDFADTWELMVSAK